MGAFRNLQLLVFNPGTYHQLKIAHPEDALSPNNKLKAKANAEPNRNQKTLFKILERYEPLIRKRWIKKAHQQRLSILLAAAPNMPKHHRPGEYNLVLSRFD